MNQPYPPEPQRSQSTTSLARLRNGANGVMGQEPDLQDPKNDFCNAFWGTGDKGYEVLMARLRGAGRTTEELRAFWRERASIEEDYAKRLSKLAKSAVARDEIGDLATSLQNVLSETSAQAGYHASLAQEIRTSVEGPTKEFATRLGNLKKGLQASVEKSHKNKGLQEGHANKAREKYENDCLKMNGYTANSALTQGREAEKLAGKMDRTRQTIGQTEAEFRQMVQILQGTQEKWENEWKQFCDHVQDLEEDRLALTKDIVWAYANAVSQVCVEDDSSCERIREKLETFEPANDMLAFVKGWGTGDAIPDAPRFINYSAGEYPTAPLSRPANFTRLSMRQPLSAISQYSQDNPQQQPEPQPLAPAPAPAPTQVPAPRDEPPQTNGWVSGMHGISLQDSPVPVATATAPEPQQPKQPFGGVALPGMTSPPPASSSNLPKRNSSIMPPPPTPPTMSIPEPRVPSRQSQYSAAVDDDDPMAKALADLRRDPPPPNTVRRNPSHRRPESAMSNTPSQRGVTSPPPPTQNRMSYQQGPPSNVGSPDMTLSPPAGGHTAAALAKSMEDFQRQSNRDSKRQSTNYASYANDIVGGHPSRPTSPAPGSRGPSPAMMQPPTQPTTHIADEVLSQYHQAFPGERSERSRSRAGSVNSRVSVGPEAPPQSPGPAQAPRQAFAGIGAGGGRSPSPQPPRFPSPGPSPAMPSAGALGPQNMGISLDASGGVAQDSMAEAYRRQYQQQQQSIRGGSGSSAGHGYQQNAPAPQQGGYAQNIYDQRGRPTSQYGNSQPPPTQSQPSYGGTNQYPQAGGSYSNSQPPPANLQSRPGGYANAQSPPAQYQNNVSQSPTTYTSSKFGGPPNQQPQQSSRNSYAGGYQQQAPPPQQQPQQQQRNSYARSPSPAPNAYRAPSPAPIPQQQQYGGAQNGYRAPSPQPPQQWQSQQQQAAQRGRSPSPQPGVPPANAAPTGQWSTTGLPVLFYVKALYDYAAQSAAEFDFQQGDIIAVTSTPDDGWWSGELLDEARRLPGRTDFPSNFVCLF